jgi:hypothetical protein
MMVLVFVLWRKVEKTGLKIKLDFEGHMDLPKSNRKGMMRRFRITDYR